MTKIINSLPLTRSENKKWALLTMYVQERAFVNWCNLVLRKKGFQIKTILDLEDGVCLLLILKSVSVRKVKVEPSAETTAKNWQIILNVLEEENIHVPESPDTVSGQRKAQIISFIVWRIILRFQICGDILTDEKFNATDYNQAPARLLRWVKHKIRNTTVTNFSSDWTDGSLLCNLTNAIRPGSITEDMLTHKKNNEINVRLACTTAEDELGIPELIAPYEIANGMADEKSMMIYIALFRSADRMLNKTTYTSDTMVIDNNEITIEKPSLDDDFLGVPHDKQKVVAFGAGLRWGQVGRPSEFFLQVCGPEFADLSISIECRPFDHRTTHYKPNLQIKSLDKASYLVRYTPTRPGDYVLNVYCSGQHIPNSPFCLSVRETLLPTHYEDDEIMISFNPARVTFTGSHLIGFDDPDVPGQCKEQITSIKDDSAFDDDDDLSSFADSMSKCTSISNLTTSFTDGESIESSYKHKETTTHDTEKKLNGLTKPEFEKIQIYGNGLRIGEVGLVSSFHVCTPSGEKGPLSVSITCPALSIPVPSVKTYLHDTCTMHDVDYLPTEPGIYQIDVNWGETPIEGSPFYLTVTETNEKDTDQNVKKEETEIFKEARISYYRPSTKDNVIIYHSATTGDNNERVNKTLLENILREENPLDSVICITMDLELKRIGRKKIFDKASSKKLPMVFVNDQYIGSFDEIMSLYNKGRLKESLLRYKSKSK